MKKIKAYLIKRKKICILGTCIVVVMIAIIGYFYYQNAQKQKTLESMKITFNDVTEIEYGTKDYDVEKKLIQEVKNAEIKDIPKVDTMKIGEQTLQFTLMKDGLEKQFEYKINVVDTKVPEIILKKDLIEITVGDTFDINSNIESIKDIVDGDISFNDKALEINKKATEEYNKLDAKEIKNDTKVANTPLNEFLIEDIHDKEEKNLYLKNCYYIDSKVDTSKSGEYKANIITVDKNGLKTVKELTVSVKEKEVEQSQGDNVSANNQGSSSSQSSHSTVKKGSKQDIVNTALAQVGKRYVRDTQGPDTFDCSGLIYYAYTQNGWSIPRSLPSRATKLSSYKELQPGDIIYMPEQHHVALYIGNEQCVEAKNSSLPVLISTMRSLVASSTSMEFYRY